MRERLDRDVEIGLGERNSLPRRVDEHLVRSAKRLVTHGDHPAVGGRPTGKHLDEAEVERQEEHRQALAAREVRRERAFFGAATPELALADRSGEPQPARGILLDGEERRVESHAGRLDLAGVFVDGVEEYVAAVAVERFVRERGGERSLGVDGESVQPSTPSSSGAGGRRTRMGGHASFSSSRRPPSSLTGTNSQSDRKRTRMSGDHPQKKSSADSAEVRARVEQHMEIARICAVKIRRQTGANPSVLDDLQSMGLEGLLEAARTYAPDRGVPFKNWAYLKVRGAILDGMRSQAELPRGVYAKLRALQAANEVREGTVEDESAAAAETAESADARVAGTANAMAMAMAAAFLGAKRGVPDTVPDSRAESPEDVVMEKELLDKVRAAMAARPEGERKLLERMYFGGATLEEAAGEQGLSKSWGCRLHARALEAVAADVREAVRKGA